MSPKSSRPTTWSSRTGSSAPSISACPSTCSSSSASPSLGPAPAAAPSRRSTTPYAPSTKTRRSRSLVCFGARLLRVHSRELTRSTTRRPQPHPRLCRRRPEQHGAGVGPLLRDARLVLHVGFRLQERLQGRGEPTWRAQPFAQGDDLVHVSVRVLPSLSGLEQVGHPRAIVLQTAGRPSVR